MALQTRKWSKCRNVAAVLVTASCLGTGIGSAWAQTTRTAPIAPTTDNAGGTSSGAEPVLQDDTKRVSTIELIVGQSRILSTPWPVKRLSVTDPAIADVDLTTPSRLQIKGKSVGMTELTIWSERGESWQAKLEVKADVSRLQDQMRKLFNNDSLQVTQVDDVIAIKGTLAQTEDVAQLRQFLKLSDLRYLDLTTVAGLQQVQLQVKVAEVSRTALRLLGVNMFYGGNQWFGGTQIGSSAGPFTPMNVGIPSGTPISAAGSGNLPFQALSDISVPQAATLFAGFPSSDLQVFVQALSENQYLRILAEPTLVARSGQEATFLAGGEFPIPIANQNGGSTQISIEYKNFGVQLRFLPTVMGNGKIQLKLTPEISQLSDVGAVVVLGTRVPSLLTRRVQTSLDLQSGQTFVIAGLINQTDSAQASRIPGIGDMPVIGALFRSVRYQRNDTEMVVICTASLVEPSSNELDPMVPGDLHVVPNDWELYSEGRLQGRTKARVAPTQKERLEHLGLDRLRGPGAWAAYEDAPKTLASENGSSK